MWLKSIKVLFSINDMIYHNNNCQRIKNVAYQKASEAY